MKILYNGSFLREGLLELGHEVAVFRPTADKSLAGLLRSHCPEADVVLLELFGARPMPKGIHECPLPLAAYCVDTPINEYWLIHLMELFDFVFVDQLSTVARFHGQGIEAEWLPLCASRADFREDAAKEHLITFVGRTSEHRVKRANLLKVVSARHPVNVVQGVTRDEMQDVFARSHVVLNENFFPGMNLRVFQGLASGSLLLTEEGGAGVEECFTPGEHMVCYNPDTILPVVDDVASHPSYWKEVAANGRELCRKRHMSVHRASHLFECLASERKRNQRRPEARRVFAEARAKYLHSMRFGGSYAESFEMFTRLAGEGGPLSGPIDHMVGSVVARRGSPEKAKAYLARAVEAGGGDGLVAAVKLALVHVREGNGEAAAAVLAGVRDRLPAEGVGAVDDFSAQAGAGDLLYAASLAFARVLLGVGEVLDVGFLKQLEDLYPDKAFDYADLAFRQHPSSLALALVIECTRRAGVAPEALSYLKEAIVNCEATDDQIAYSVEMARMYYDYEYAESALRSLRLKMSRERKARR